MPSNVLQMGRVYYLTWEIIFPDDNDHWVQQDPIPGASPMAIHLFIQGTDLTKDQKAKLQRDLKCEWKDERGVWNRLRIETTKRNRKWGV